MHKEDHIRRPSHRRRGFTLIEISVVVVIIAVLAALAVPAYQKSVERSKATEASTILNKIISEQEKLAAFNNGTYADNFGQLSPVIQGKKTSGKTVESQNFTYSLEKVGNIAYAKATPKSKYKYTIRTSTYNTTNMCAEGDDAGMVSSLFKGCDTICDSIAQATCTSSGGTWGASSCSCSCPSNKQQVGSYCYTPCESCASGTASTGHQYVEQAAAAGTTCCAAKPCSGKAPDMTEPCGNKCGTRTRTAPVVCDGTTGKWTEPAWGACTGEGECEEGKSGSYGGGTRICLPGCTWGPVLCDTGTTWIPELDKCSDKIVGGSCDDTECKGGTVTIDTTNSSKPLCICTCPKGTTYDGKGNCIADKPVVCDDGYKLVSGKCEPICAPGTYYEEQLDGAWLCQSGSCSAGKVVVDDIVCKTPCLEFCRLGTERDPSVKYSEDGACCKEADSSGCATGQIKVEGVCKTPCRLCLSGYERTSSKYEEDGACCKKQDVKCGENETWDGKKCVCQGKVLESSGKCCVGDNLLDVRDGGCCEEKFCSYFNSEGQMACAIQCARNTPSHQHGCQSKYLDVNGTCCTDYNVGGVKCTPCTGGYGCCYYNVASQKVESCSGGVY
ncbi:prepilin-type N-terminal cleavage/methylation domain-containing protein [Parelusimicrobium proximum]|uniref:prepilin-type N-terminal cleavage/methylation domain-containing protein n=1 Tax=Parelusimicrobium proximum TaxID=3228953 RepID=UPI003D16EC08